MHGAAGSLTGLLYEVSGSEAELGASTEVSQCESAGAHIGLRHTSRTDGARLVSPVVICHSHRCGAGQRSSREALRGSINCIGRNDETLAQDLWVY